MNEASAEVHINAWIAENSGVRMELFTLEGEERKTIEIQPVGRLDCLRIGRKLAGTKKGHACVIAGLFKDPVLIPFEHAAVLARFLVCASVNTLGRAPS